MSYIYPGIVIGALYALLGGSLTLTYSLTGVINLAVGAMAYASAYLFYHLVSVDGWSLWLAGSTCVAASIAVGFVLWALIFRNLEKKNLIVQLTATIGLAVAIPALMQLLLPLQQVYQTPGILPNGFHTYSWGFLNTTRNQVAAVVGAAVCVVALIVLVEKSRFGLSARAVVDRPAIAEGVGINTTRLSAVTWMIASAMTGIAGLLLNPLIQLDAAQYTTLSVAALSVALVGRFRSLGVTALAGVALGIVSSLMTGYAPVGSVIGSGMVPALPFFLLLILLIVGRSLGGTRRDSAADASRLSPEELQPRRLTSQQRWVRRGILITVALAMTWVAMFVFDEYWTGVFAAGISFAVIFLGFTVSTGEGGILCLGQAGFAAAGAFVAGRLATEANLPLFAAAVVGVAAAMVCGIVIGLLGTRLDQVGFALVTLSFALFCEKFMFNVQTVVPLAGVLYPEFHIGGLRGTQSSILLGVVVFALVAGLLTFAKRGRFGRLCAAVRGNPVAGESIGINIKGARVGIIAIGSAIGGLGGVLLGIEQGAIGISDFTLLIGLVWLAVVVTVGVRGYQGALVAGLMFTIFPALFQYVHVSQLGQLPTVLFGLGAIGLAREPRGFLYETKMRFRSKRAAAKPPAELVAAATAPVAAEPIRVPLEGAGR
ncbi:MAG: ABC-type branched-chain amino acid transport system, permease component [Ilumatobacteraceae bacterium]|nr:ABC-type branched-chain amino acid transport system, permease component [Ilumatobacteraceae bacterium]